MHVAYPLPFRLISTFLKIFYRLLYNQFAWTYDWVAAVVSLGRWKDWGMTVLPYLTGPRVLELGCGPGHLQAALCARGVQRIGLDASRWMLGLSFRRLFGLGCFPLLVSAYAQSVPFQTSSIHQVVATFPTEFIVNPQALAEVCRVLTPGGELVVLPIAWITGQSWLDRLAAGIFRITNQSPDWDERFTLPFKQAGFIVQVEYIQLKSSLVLLIRAAKPAKLL